MRRAKQVPELVQAIKDGRINVSAARKIAPVINNENKDAWLELASSSSVSSIEKAGHERNKKAAASAAKDESNLSDENAECESNRATHVEAKAENARRADFVRKPLSSKTKHIVHLRDGSQCTVVDDRGARCTQTRWLDVHHIVEVSRGGDNSRRNLRTICGHHHRRIHSHHEPVS